MERKPFEVEVVKRSSNTGTVKAFITVRSRDSLIIRGITYHEAPNGRRWIGLPGQPRIGSDDKVLRDPVDGRIQFYKILLFADREKWHDFEHWLLSEMAHTLPALAREQRQPEFRGGAQ